LFLLLRKVRLLVVMDQSYPATLPVALRVLPALVDRLETVTVEIENVRSVTTEIIIQARARLAVAGRARRLRST
jgi:hypothetical protein